MTMSPALQRALAVLRDCKDPVTPGWYAERCWPDSPSWHHHSNVGHGSTTGVGIKQRAGAMLRRLEKLGLAEEIRAFGHVSRFVVSSAGLRALNEYPAGNDPRQPAAWRPRKGRPMTKTSKANSAFMKPMTPSAALAAIVGSKPLPRTEVTKKLWEYIKAADLQDPDNRRVINPDATLAAVLGKKPVGMFQMTKLIGKHLS